MRLSGQHPGKAKTQKPLKYTAAQLHSKGVLQKMQGLSPAQFKSVQFEISPTQTVGVFQVRGCFMGIPMESVEVDVQVIISSLIVVLGILTRVCFRNSCKCSMKGESSWIYLAKPRSTST